MFVNRLKILKNTSFNQSQMENSRHHKYIIKIRFCLHFIFTFCGLLFLIMPPPLLAQQVSLDLGQEFTGQFAGNILQLILLMTIISIAPSILIMATSFTRVIIVLSLLRSAIGLQQTPPNAVLISLALFLTLFVMTPVFEKSYEQGIKPMMEEDVEIQEGLALAVIPFKEFMLANTRSKDIALFKDIAEQSTQASGNSGNSEGDIAGAGGGAGQSQILADTATQIELKILLPAFMISELKRAFEIGFLIFLPFLIIDMMVSATLMSMGMMMLPPVMISLPFKIIFFVVIDGWYMLSEGLVKSFIS